MGWLGWTVITALLLVLVALGALRHAVNSNGAAVLNGADRLLRGDAAIRLVAAERYGPDSEQWLEMFIPASVAPSTPLPVIVFIHGGSWASGSPDDYRFIARTLVPQGYAVVLAGYRLFPRVRYPAMLEDGAGALRWVVDNVARHGGDPGRIVVMGHSAGAYNTLMLTLDPRWLGTRRLSPAMLRGAVSLAGPADFLPLDTQATIDTFGQAPDLRDTQPIAHAHVGAPPLLLVTGDADTRVKPRNSLALAKALTAAGTPTKVVMLAGVTHEGIIKMFARPFSSDARAIDAVLPFLARVTAPSAAVQASAAQE
jgi:acetyl esterase/lipase